MRNKEPWGPQNCEGRGEEMARWRLERPENGVRGIKGVETFRSRLCSPTPKASAWSTGRGWRKGH